MSDKSSDRPKPGPSAEWKVGQRVARMDRDERGTIIEADGQIKVKWENGQTSYFDRDKPSNVTLICD